MLLVFHNSQCEATSMTDAGSGDPTHVLSDATKMLSDPTGVLIRLEGEFRVLLVTAMGFRGHRQIWR